MGELEDAASRGDVLVVEPMRKVLCACQPVDVTVGEKGEVLSKRATGPCTCGRARPTDGGSVR